MVNVILSVTETVAALETLTTTSKVHSILKFLICPDYNIATKTIGIINEMPKITDWFKWNKKKK